MWKILIIAGILVLAIGLPMGFKYLSDKKILTEESLQYTIGLFQIGQMAIDELNLTQEKKITDLTDCVLLSLNYVCDMEDTSNRQETAIAYCIELCNQMSIEINENRIAIIEKLIKLGLHDETKTSEVTSTESTTTTI